METASHTWSIHPPSAIEPQLSWQRRGCSWFARPSESLGNIEYLPGQLNVTSHKFGDRCRDTAMIGYFYLWYSAGVSSPPSRPRRKETERWLGGQAVIKDAPSWRSVQVDEKTCPRGALCLCWFSVVGAWLGRSSIQTIPPISDPLGNQTVDPQSEEKHQKSKTSRTRKAETGPLMMRCVTELH